jgi:phage tail P2-like protein
VNDIIPNPGSAVLYPGASGLERALADTDAPRLMAIDAEAIIDIWDPYACPLTLLPYLAWAMGVTFWNDQWSETTKRSWVALQWTFKSLRGTAEAIEMVVDYAGRDVSPYGYSAYKIIARPQQCFPGASITPAEREAWLETLPQVRVYFYQDTGTFPAAGMYCGMCLGGAGLPAGVGPDLEYFPFVSTAAARLGRRATWNVGGVDTDIPVTDYGNYFQVHFPGSVGAGAYVGECLGGSGVGLPMASGLFRFMPPSTAPQRLYTIAPQAESLQPVAVGPSYVAVDAQPSLVAIEGTRSVSAFAGSNYYHGAGMFLSPRYVPGTPVVSPPLVPTEPPVFPTFLLPSTSKYRLFERYAVYDMSDPPPRSSPVTMFMNNGRLGYPAFQAQVDVSMSSRASPATFRVTGSIIAMGGRFMIPHDPRPVEYVCSAIEAARRLIDQTWLWPGPRYFLIAGQPFIAGLDTFVIGQPQVGV